MKLTKILSLLLAVLMLMPMVAACSDNSENPADTKNPSSNETTAQGETVTEEATDVIYAADIPDGTRYDGYVFTVLTNIDDGTIWGDVDWSVDELTGEVVNDAVYTRTVNAEVLLGCDIQYIADQADPAGTLKNAVSAGDTDSIDMAGISTRTCFTLGQTGNLVELHTMPDLDLTAPWWDQNSINDLSINNKNYMLTGDIGTMYKKSIGVIMFNKEILTDYGLDDPSPYTLMNEGKWTIDNMISIGRNVSKDLNGDSKFDQEDQYGLIYFCDMMSLAMIGCGVNFATKNASDIPEITFYNEKTVSILDKLAELLYDKELSWSWSGNGLSEETAFTMYKANQSLFYYGELHAVATMRDMESEFGILPMPKYDETQENYYHCINPHVAMMTCVPNIASDVTRTAYIMDALGAESKNILTPAYYEVNLKGKVSRDEQSAETLDIVFNTIRYDLGYLQDWQVGNIPLNLANAYSLDLASSYSKAEKAITKLMDKTLSAFTD